MSTNVRVLQESKEVKLKCGHVTFGMPVVIYPNGRKMYDCPEGCGLIKAKR